LELINVNDYPEHDRTLYQTLQEMNTRQKNGTADYNFPRFYDHLRWHRKACCYAFAANAYEIPELQPGVLALQDNKKWDEVRDLYKEFIDVASHREGFSVFSASIEALIRLDGFESLGHDPDLLLEKNGGLAFALFFAQLGDERSYNFLLPHHDFHVFALRRHDEEIVMAHKFVALQEMTFDGNNSARNIFTQAAQVGYNHFAGYYHYDPAHNLSYQRKAIVNVANHALA
jgi:hypothetical protein